MNQPSTWAAGLPSKVSVVGRTGEGDGHRSVPPRPAASIHGGGAAGRARAREGPPSGSEGERAARRGEACRRTRQVAPGLRSVGHGRPVAAARGAPQENEIDYRGPNDQEGQRRGAASLAQPVTLALPTAASKASGLSSSGASNDPGRRVPARRPPMRARATALVRGARSRGIRVTASKHCRVQPDKERGVHDPPVAVAPVGIHEVGDGSAVVPLVQRANAAVPTAGERHERLDIVGVAAPIAPAMEGRHRPRRADCSAARGRGAPKASNDVDQETTKTVAQAAAGGGGPRSRPALATSPFPNQGGQLRGSAEAPPPLPRRVQLRDEARVEARGPPTAPAAAEDPQPVATVARRGRRRTATQRPCGEEPNSAAAAGHSPRWRTRPVVTSTVAQRGHI